MARTSTVTVRRSVSLRSIAYMATSDAPEPTSPLHVLMKELWQKAPNVVDRHLPELPEDRVLEEGTQCRFCDQLTEVPGGAGVMFRINAYEQGRQPTGLRDNFDTPDADSLPTELRDDEGQEMHLVHQASVLIWNRVALIEYSKGAGGAGGLAHYLTRMMRRHSVTPQKMPNIRFNEVVPPDIMTQINEGGGVKQAELKAEPTRGGGPIDGKFSGPLTTAMSRSRNPKWAKLIIAPDDGEVHSETVSEMLDEYEDGMLEMIGFELRRGGKIWGDQFKFRRPIELPAGRDRRPDRHELERKMCNLLMTLRQPAGPQGSGNDYLVTSDGHVRSAISN